MKIALTVRQVYRVKEVLKLSFELIVFNKKQVVEFKFVYQDIVFY